jgi:hypothetical protein
MWQLSQPVHQWWIYWPIRLEEYLAGREGEFQQAARHDLFDSFPILPAQIIFPCLAARARGLRWNLCLPAASQSNLRSTCAFPTLPFIAPVPIMNNILYRKEFVDLDTTPMLPLRLVWVKYSFTPSSLAVWPHPKSHSANYSGNCHPLNSSSASRSPRYKGEAII